MAMRRSTAIRHLVELVDAANVLRDVEPDVFHVPLVELWVAGELLDSAAEFDRGHVILMFDIPPHELPWLSVHPTAGWIASEMRLGKRPLDWADRPAAWPAWNCRHARVARIWTARHGLDETMIEALRTGNPPGVTAPATDELVAQCKVELAVAKAHLGSIVERYWDPNWRRANRHATTPEDHLWRAAQAVIEIDAAIAARAA